MSGLFDNIASLFTGSNAQQAAQQQIAGLNQGYGLASGNIGNAINTLQQQYGLGQNALTTGYGNATNDINAGNTTATNAINAGTSNATNALTSNYMSALLPFMQNYSQAQQGTTALGNALGLNGGAAGASAAAAAYASNPAYQFQMQQGDQNVLRSGSQTGTLASGGTLNALQTQGEGLANSTYQQYVNNLMPYLGQANTAASGIGNTYTGLGNSLSSLYQGQGTNLANLATGTGSQLAGLSTGLGTASAGLSTGLGNSTANQYDSLANLGWQYGTGTGNANANATLAGNTGAANLLNLGGGLLSLGTNTIGGGMLSGLGSSLSNFFGGGSSLGSTVNNAASYAASDERLKDDIEKVGELYDGSNVYKYRYKWDDPAVVRLGLMAQEVEQNRPDAVAEFGGYKFVNYSKATDHASLLAKFQNHTEEKSNNDNTSNVVSSLTKFLDAA